MISKIVNFFDEGTGGADHPVYVGLLKQGTVVQDTELNEIGGREPHNQFGHIVGFGRNNNDELLIRVQWDGGCQGDYDAIHPCHLILLA